MTEEEAFEVYLQGARDASNDAKLDEKLAREYFQRWWDKRKSARRPIDTHAWFLD